MKIKVTAGAKEDKVIGQDELGILKVRVKANANKGKANQAVVDVLAKYYDRPKRCIIIKSGQTEKIKTVIVENE